MLDLERSNRMKETMGIKRMGKESLLELYAHPFTPNLSEISRLSTSVQSNLAIVPSTSVANIFFAENIVRFSMSVDNYSAFTPTSQY